MGTGRLEGVVRFAGFELDVRSAELRSPEGNTVRLSEQPLRILVALLERPGELVLREDLRKRLWPNDTIVEFEHSINAAVNRLRQALGDAADNPKFIETFARRGYRWKTPVQWEQPQQFPAPTKPADGNLIGKRVSHYRVLELLGGGGMGVVYKAEDIKLGRRVALKFLPEELAADPAARQRFEREARAASALNHPNICTIYGVEEHEGQPFIVMELLEGRTLREVIAAQTASSTKSNFDLQPLLDLAVQIVTGLAAAHEKGIIHRDIKPANIFITSHGQAKILDFGLAKLHEVDSAETQSHISAETETTHEVNPLLTLTRTGVTVGTAAYMSPEQVRGEKLDARTDLFSFGLVMYEMLTAHRPFPGETAAVLRDAILNQTPAPVRQLNSRIPRKLENIIAKAIEKDRDARYQTADRMRFEIELLHRQAESKKGWRWRAGLAVAATALVATVVFLLNRPPRTISVAPEFKLRPITTNSTENPVIGGTISPDGKYLAYSDKKGLHLKLIETNETRTIPDPEELKGRSVKWVVTVWFPNSARFLANAHPATEEWNEWNSGTASIWSISVLGGSPTKLRDQARACAVSPDGSMISFGANTSKLGDREIWFMGPNGEQPRKYFETKEGTGMDCWGWSPDGNYYGWVLNDSSGPNILSQKISGGPVVSLFKRDELSKINDIIWLHNGRLVYDIAEPDTGVCNYWIARIDPDTGRRLEQPRRLTNWPNGCVSSGSASSDDKKITFAAWTGFFTTYVADLDAGGTRLRNVRHFVQEDADIYPFDWTPDSKSVFLARHRKPDGHSLYKQALDSDRAEMLNSDGAGWLSFGVVSPDGKWIIGRAWLETESFPPTTRMPILRFPISGGSPETILELSHLAVVSCAKLPSKTCVLGEESDNHKQLIVSAFDAMTGRGPELVRFDLDRPVDNVADNLLCVISPDGTRLALTHSPEGNVEIYSIHGQLLQKVHSAPLGKIIWLAWSRDQRGFFVSRKVQADTELVHLDLQGHTESLRRCVGEACIPVPSPDGKHLAITDHSQLMNMWMMENF